MSSRSTEQSWYSCTNLNNVSHAAIRQIQLPDFDHFIQGLDWSHLAESERTQRLPAPTSPRLLQKLPPISLPAGDLWLDNTNSPVRHDLEGYQRATSIDDWKEAIVERRHELKLAQLEESCLQSSYLQQDFAVDEVSQIKGQTRRLNRDIHQQQGLDKEVFKGRDRTRIRFNNSNRATVHRDRDMKRAGMTRQRAGQACNAVS